MSTKEAKREFKELTDIDDIKILLPDGTFVHSSVREEFSINKDLPADLLEKMSNCAAKYARWGMINADLSAFLEVKRDEYDVFEKAIMSKSRNALGKSTESAIREKAVLDNLAEYQRRKRVIIGAGKALENVKRMMRACEIMSEMTRSIVSYMRREMDLSEGIDPVLQKRGSLKSVGGKKNV